MNITLPWQKIMRITILAYLFVIMASSLLQANTGYGQALEKRISATYHNTSAEAVIRDLQKQTGTDFGFTADLGLEKVRVQQLQLNDRSIRQTLEQLLSGRQIGFKEQAGMVLLFKIPQPGRISGRVQDEKGEALPGASVRIVETGNAVQTDAAGNYLFNMTPGSYTMEVSYISYQTRRITGITVTEGKNTPLNIVLKPSRSALKEVVITSGYRKASAEGLLVKQKNASEISNGISGEQLSRTPDKNIGESLKRISGVSSVSNKFVLVRGIGERYNAAMLDGTVLPSTEAQSRNFSFDLIPSNLVDNVVVSKTVTPDMNASFGGGLIQINTRDIPNENFLSMSAGVSFNDQSTGKEFLSHKRGKYDFLGFDDGGRDFPTGLVHTDRGVAPNITMPEAAYQEMVNSQSRKFTNDNFTVYKNKTAPSQNYQFTIGRLLALDTVNNAKFGFTGSLSYRNTQNINIIDNQNRSDWNMNYDNNHGASYEYNTTWGGLLNAGLQWKNNRISLRNTYTRMYDNSLVRITGFTTDESTFTGTPNRIQEADDPTFTYLLQNKLNGQHQLGALKLEWEFARAGIDRQEKDLAIATQTPRLVGKDYLYYYDFGNSTEARFQPMSRQSYRNKEQHYSWNVAGTLPFNWGALRNSVKMGYAGNVKKAGFDWQIASFSANYNKVADSLRYLPVSEMLKPQYIGPNGFVYSVGPYFLDNYEGKSQTQAGYVMFDNRLLEKLRLVWGLRAEYYEYTQLKNGYNTPSKPLFNIKRDDRWQWLPSANLTYSPIKSMNIRAAFSSSVVRPELLDNSQFLRYSPYLGAQFGNQGLFSTRINSYDFKTEWFPGLGEVISVGGYYKYFDKPAELTLSLATGNIEYYIRSSDWAKVYGLELEARKSLDFIANALRNITAYGNLTLQHSQVRSTYNMSDPNNPGTTIQGFVKEQRSMYGQSPYLMNAGLQYAGEHFGLNAAYNKTGYKTYVVSDDPTNIEYEMPREQLDLQLSYRFFNRRAEIRLNASNITNNVSTFFRNTISYEQNPDAIPDADYSDSKRLKAGYTNKYEKGDQITFKQRFGRTFSTSLTWNF
jgi:TonB-dependent receptor